MKSLNPETQLKIHAYKDLQSKIKYSLRRVSYCIIEKKVTSSKRKYNLINFISYFHYLCSCNWSSRQALHHPFSMIIFPLWGGCSSTEHFPWKTILCVFDGTSLQLWTLFKGLRCHQATMNDQLVLAQGRP